MLLKEAGEMYISHLEDHLKHLNYIMEKEMP